MYQLKLTSILLAITLLVSACSNPGTGYAPPEQNTSQPPLPFAQQLQQAMDRGLAQSGGTGLSVALRVPGYQTWVGVSGVSHAATPITPDMVFDAGSIHKQFTAATILLLNEEGLLSLDDPLHRWLPDFPNVDRNITIRQLLNHTGGVFDMVRHPDYWPAMLADRHRVWQPQEILDNFLLEPYFARGQGWHYSTPGYILLRLVIEAATGEPLLSAYRERLWTPLGLQHTYLAVYEALPGSTAHGWFDVDGDGEYEDVYQFKSFNSSTAGAVFTNPGDLAAWSQALFHEGRVLSEQSLAEMLTLHAPNPGEPLAAGYGLGVMRFSPELFNGLEIIGHGGNAAGMAAGSLYLPEYGASLAIMDNTHEGLAMPVINELLSILTRSLDALP